MSSIFDLDDEEKYIIDSNDRILQRLEEYQEELVQKEAQKKQKMIQSFYESLEFDEEGKPIIPTDEEGYMLVPMDDEGNPLVDFDEEGNLIMPPDPSEEPEGSGEFVEGLFPADDYSEEGDVDIGEMPSASEQEIIDAANAEAALIIEDAQANAEAIFEHAKEEGRKEGYQDGLTQAHQEYVDKEAQLEEERSQFLDQIKAAQESMEAELVDVITEIVDRTFGVMYSDNKQILLHLIYNALLNIENSKTFLIRVNEKNHTFLQENKPKLLERVGSDVVLDIIMDPLMDEGGCLIETDGGIFDCGMDVQMSNLIKSIKALSI